MLFEGNQPWLEIYCK